ncbi:alpha-tocopherol transfer protein-like [Pararge aegeria]|uniref:alpha-tocopherol transfer protein-like n=1 Tax=Pararge aegeria TaxID=116150 RepID=UPI0019CFACB0|nr:alpha-tocopherol transfer protein-like [Pararge aegeria]
MDTLQYHPLLLITEDDIKKARQFYNVEDETRIKDSLKAIESWCKKQDHLVEAYQYLHPNMLERMFLLARGSVEMTKIKFDKLFTMRGMMPDICLNKSLQEFDELSECLRYVPLPKLNPGDQSRVMVTQVISGKWEKFNLLSYMRYCFLIGEYRLHYDYSLSDRYIIDLKDINISILAKLNPIILKRGEILCTEGFGTKIKGIHILNAPSFVDKFVSLIKQGLKEKVANRLHVHNTYEDLHKEISKEILPKEYGGESLTCEKLAERWKDTLKTKEAEKIIYDSNKLITDETKRTTAKFNEEYLGMPGSFRSLTVD